MVKIYILNAMLADKRNKSLEKKENKDGQNSTKSDSNPRQRPTLL